MRTSMTSLSQRTGAVAAATVLAAFGLSACTSDDSPEPAPTATSSSPAPSPTGTSTADAATCDSADAVRADLDAFTDASTYTGGVDGVQSAIDDLSASVQTLRDTAGDSWGPQIDALQTAVTGLREAVSGLNDGSLGENLSQLREAAGGVVETGETLIDEISATCGD